MKNLITAITGLLTISAIALSGGEPRCAKMPPPPPIRKAGPQFCPKAPHHCPGRRTFAPGFGREKGKPFFHHGKMGKRCHKSGGRGNAFAKHPGRVPSFFHPFCPVKGFLPPCPGRRAFTGRAPHFMMDEDTFFQFRKLSGNLFFAGKEYQKAPGKETEKALQKAITDMVKARQEFEIQRAKKALARAENAVKEREEIVKRILSSMKEKAPSSPKKN